MDAESEADTPRRNEPRRRLDRRTVLICVAVALIAAVAGGGVAAAIVNRDSRPQGDLTEAVSVPDNVGFTRMDGTKANLGKYDGQKLVVNFFSSTCVPCRKEMPALERVQRATGDEVSVLGIAVQDDPKEAAALVNKTGVTYEIGQDATGRLFNATGGSVLPFTLFVAGDGTIMERHSGALTEAELRSKISSNLLAGG